MISDEERREVARRLRENAEAHPDMSLILNLAFADDSLKPDGAMEWKVTSHDAAMRLADLIEPSCDRAALLVQVEELEKCAWYFGLDFDADEPLRDRLKEASEDFAGCARRIREACGEVVE